jgi:ribonuclease P/MRP protein subunit POP1
MSSAKKEDAPANKLQKIRQKRKNHYSCSDPFYQSLQDRSVPQFISLQKLVESRAYELGHFINIQKNKVGTKMEHQLLPKHMRRRAMSHNYYRMPLRIRYRALSDKHASEARGTIDRSRCRKHRRKPKYLLNDYENRQRKLKWLETHIWHTKRFKMADMWGHKVPLNCSDKGERAAYKFVGRHSACLIDRSYFKFLKVSF